MLARLRIGRTYERGHNIRVIKGEQRRLTCTVAARGLIVGLEDVRADFVFNVTYIFKK